MMFKKKFFLNTINLTEQNRQLSFQLSVRLASVIEDLLTWQIFDVRNRDVLKIQVVAPIPAFPYRQGMDLGPCHVANRRPEIEISGRSVDYAKSARFLFRTRFLLNIM